MKNILKSTTFLAIFACWLWSTAFAAVKIGLEYNTPFQFAGIRFIISGIFLFLYFGKPAAFYYEFKSNWKFILVLAVIQFSAQYAFFYTGMNLVPSAFGATGPDKGRVQGQSGTTGRGIAICKQFPVRLFQRFGCQTSNRPFASGFKLSFAVYWRVNFIPDFHSAGRDQHRAISSGLFLYAGLVKFPFSRRFCRLVHLAAKAGGKSFRPQHVEIPDSGAGCCFKLDFNPGRKTRRNFHFRDGRDYRFAGNPELCQPERKIILFYIDWCPVNFVRFLSRLRRDGMTGSWSLLCYEG